MQIEFFNQISIFFPKLPSELLFTISNVGYRNKIEARIILKTQGVKSGISDILLLIPKKGYSCLYMAFKIPVGKYSGELIEFQKQLYLKRFLHMRNND